MYCKRLIDNYLSEWASRDTHKPVLLRGARQVGKSTAVKELSKKFDSFVEINFEKQPKYKILFDDDLDVKRIVPQISAIYGTSIKPGQTLLFLDEIQECPRAIMALRFFKEDMPELHVIAAGSLLEFALKELPTFGVGRIHSMFMYPMTFDEFLEANGQQLLIETRNEASIDNPLPEPIHNKLVDFLRTYMLVGGMPEAVKTWVVYHDYIRCQEVQDDIVVTYEDDFPKYKKNVDPTLLRRTLRSVAVQAGKKFVYTKVGLDYKTAEVKKAVELLTLAGILHPVTHTDANGLPLGSEEDKSYQKMLLLDTGARRCAVEFRSYSKTAGFTGVRCGFTVVPKDLTVKAADGSRVALNAVWNRRQCTKFNGTSYITQRAAEAIYTPEGKAQVRATIDYYLRNASTMLSGLRAVGLEAYGGVNSPYIWLKTPAGVTSWEFFDKLLNEANVVGTPGAGFGPAGEGYLRLTAFGTYEDCLEAMDRIAKNIKK